VLNLMRLEMKKYHIGSYIKRAIFANFVILAVIFMLIFITKIEGDQDFRTYQRAFSIIDSGVRAVFIIFASVLIAKFIIGEFKYKTITVAFMYPINRKKLIASKLAIVVLFTFSAILIIGISHNTTNSRCDHECSFSIMHRINTIVFRYEKILYSGNNYIIYINCIGRIIKFG